MADLPWSNETEQQVLSLLISVNGAAALDRLIAEEGLNENDFFGNRNREIYLGILKLAEDEKPIDIASVAFVLNYSPESDKVAYLKNVAMTMGISTAAGYYVKRLKELTKRRQYIMTAQYIQQISRDTTQSMELASAEIEKLLDADIENDTLKDGNKLYLEAYADIVDLYSRKGDIPGHRTPWKKLDKLTGGLGNGELIIIGGRPGMGKSVIGQNIAEFIAFHEREVALVFSLEMQGKQVMSRVLAAETGVRMSGVKTGKLSADDFGSIGLIANLPELGNLIIEEKAEVSIEYIKSVCRMTKRRYKKIGVVIVDYLQLMQLSSKARNKTDALSEVTRGLKLLAKELNCPVVALSQLNRDNEREQNKRPKLSDLRDSGALEQDADKVFLLYREAYYRDNAPKDALDVIVAKCRDGKTGAVQLSWQPQIMRVMNPEEVVWLNKEAEERRRKLKGEQIGMEGNT